MTFQRAQYCRVKLSEMRCKDILGLNAVTVLPRSLPIADRSSHLVAVMRVLRAREQSPLPSVKIHASFFVCSFAPSSLSTHSHRCCPDATPSTGRLDRYGIARSHLAIDKSACRQRAAHAEELVRSELRM